MIRFRRRGFIALPVSLRWAGLDFRRVILFPPLVGFRASPSTFVISETKIADKYKDIVSIVSNWEFPQFGPPLSSPYHPD